MSTKTACLSNDNLTLILNKLQEQKFKKKLRIYQSTTNSFYYTSKTLLQHINDLVKRDNGRISISKLCLELSIDKQDLFNVVSEISNDDITWNIVTTKSKDEIIIDTTLYSPILHSRIVDLIEESYYNSKDSDYSLISLSDLVTQLDLTFEIIESCIADSLILMLLNKNQANVAGISTTTTTTHRREVTTREIYAHRFLEIKGALLGISQPTSLNSLVDEYKLDSVDVIKECLNDIPGGLYHSNEVYIPYVYLHKQRKVFDDFFASNGYISEKYCSTLGYDHLWTTPKLIDYMKETFPNAINLSSSQNQVVINPIKIFPPIEASILEGISNKSIINFLSLIPEPLYPHSLDLIQKYILPNLQDDKVNADNGIILIPTSLDYGLYISSHLYKSIHDDSLPKWINEHTVATAKRVFQENSNSSSKHKAQNTTHIITTNSSRNKKKAISNDLDQDDDVSILTSATSSKKKKRNKSSKKQHESSNDKIIETSDTQLPTDTIISLHDLAKLVATNYPDFFTIHTNLGYNDIEYDDDIKSWVHDINKDDTINEEECEKLGPIHHFLQIRLYDYIKRLSIEAYHQEYNQLQALSLQTAINSNTMNISPKMKQKMISSFENVSCFPTACHWIQLLNKTFTYLDQHLSGCDAMVANVQSIIASDFAKRITQYCLFLHDIPLDIFSFSNSDSKEEDKGEMKLQEQSKSSPEFPSFCQPFNISDYQLSSQNIILSCTSSRDPLHVLREELSNGVGVALARMWIYTGSKHYQNNSKVSVNWESFLLHLDSNVYLFTDGIPFKKVDKKSEKKILFERKCTLVQVLSSINNDETDHDHDVENYYNHAKIIISVVIILFFQQVKHVIITADFLFNESSVDVVELLLKNDKIPKKVRDDVRLLYNLVQEKKEDGLLSDKELVQRVKSYGLCRDITKL